MSKLHNRNAATPAIAMLLKNVNLKGAGGGSSREGRSLPVVAGAPHPILKLWLKDQTWS